MIKVGIKIKDDIYLWMDGVVIIINKIYWIQYL
jgi:hypothetical protein